MHVAEVAELADATDSKSVSRKGVWVRVPPSVFGRPEEPGSFPVDAEHRRRGFRDPRSSGRRYWKGLSMGYVFGMFMVVIMLAIGLGGVFFVFGGSNRSATRDDH